MPRRRKTGDELLITKAEKSTRNDTGLYFDPLAASNLNLEKAGHDQGQLLQAMKWDHPWEERPSPI